jgi:OFA family oxalate/formate antiporter-like MFS transporter
LSVSEPEGSEPRGWPEVGKLFIILTAIMAVRNSFGVFFTSIENQFGLSRGATSAYFSISMVLGALFAILGGRVLDRFGPKIVFVTMGALTLLSLLLTGQTTSGWQLFFTYSLLLAAGTGAGFALVMATVSRWFVKRRGLALGIALSGDGVGTLAVAPLATFLITSFNWRTAYSIMGVFAGMVIIGLALFLKKVPRNPKLVADNHSSAGSPGNAGNARQMSALSLAEAMRTGSLWFLGTVYLLFSLTLYLVLTHIVPHATDLGITEGPAAVIISLIGGSSVPGRLVIGWASDKTNRKLLAIFCALFQGVAMVWLAWSTSLWMFYIFAIVFGLTYGGISNLMASLISDTFGTTYLGTIIGALMVGFTLGAAIGPALGGFVFDTTHGYLAAFIVGAGASLLEVLFLVLIKRETKTALVKLT